ncbi:MAG: chloride channel protein [Solirubrobacteraceae bacterium]
MAAPAAKPTDADGAAEVDSGALLRDRRFVVLLAIAAIVGIIVSLAAWCFLELIYQIQQELYHHLPNALGYTNGPPKWWSLPILAIAGVITAFAIVRLPGNGGHIPAEGLKVGGGPTRPIELPGIVLAGLASIGLGVVIGPEAPLIAMGAGLGVATIKAARKDVPQQLLVVVAAAGSFAALSFVFSSPIIAAVILIEATGLGGSRLPIVLLPGLVGAAIGTLISVGMGSFTGLSTSAYALGALPLPKFERPTAASFGWAIALSVVIALVAYLIRTGGISTHRVVRPRPFLMLPAAGLVVSGLAIAFSQASGKSINEVLFSGQDALPGLVSSAGKWSLSALALLIVFKGIAYAVSLGSFRGGPTFPAIFLGAAGGLMASHLPGFDITPAVAVGMGAATVAILRLPLSAIVIASVLTAQAGPGSEPLTIIGVVVCYLVTVRLPVPQLGPSSSPSPAAAGAGPEAAQSAASRL